MRISCCNCAYWESTSQQCDYHGHQTRANWNCPKHEFKLSDSDIKDATEAHWWHIAGLTGVFIIVFIFILMVLSHALEERDAEVFQAGVESCQKQQ